MKAVTLERRTRRLVQLWTIAAIAAVAAALAVALLAGGTSQWVRWLLGAVAIYGFAGASRFRTGLHVGALAGVAMIAIVPHDAVVDRGVIAAVGAVLILLACELTHVARRLVTIAPVQSTRRDVGALGLLTIAATAAVAIAGLVAQLDRWSERPLIIGLVVSGVALIALIGNEAANPG